MCTGRRIRTRKVALKTTEIRKLWFHPPCMAGVETRDMQELTVMQFISEDDLQNFEGWSRYQCLDLSSPEELERWRGVFDEMRQRSSGSPKVGLMKLKPTPGEYRYAVAVRDAGLWLALWVRRSPKGEFFVLMPRPDRLWDIHTSYHLDGTFHMKSDGRTVLPKQKRQPLTGAFRGNESLGSFAGYGPKSVGAICDPTAFSGVVESPPGILGPRDGQITVELIEPNGEPAAFPWREVATRKVFRDVVPWVVVTVGSCG